MIKLLEKLLGMLYFRPCIFCGSEESNDIVCENCLKKIKHRPQGIYRNIHGCRVYSCCIYSDIVKNMILQLKYNGKKQLAPVLAGILFGYFKEIPDEKRDYTIIPVPIHRKRRKERGFNHTELIGEEFIKLTGFDINKELILRTKDTKKQYNLTTKEREENIKGAFSFNEAARNKPACDTPLLILDDITSTGITLEEMIITLKNAGYNNISAIVVASPVLIH